LLASSHRSTVHGKGFVAATVDAGGRLPVEQVSGPVAKPKRSLKARSRPSQLEIGRRTRKPAKSEAGSLTP
jgi:hypothetical protein